jgi:hypothetical protein
MVCECDNHAWVSSNKCMCYCRYRLDQASVECASEWGRTQKADGKEAEGYTPRWPALLPEFGYPTGDPCRARFHIETFVAN